MKKQLFGVAVILAFAFSTVAFPAFAQAQQGGQEQDKSKAKQAKPEKSQPQDEKSQAKPEKKQGKQQGETQRGEMRFRGLDRDQDGIISRDEWRSDADRSFANQDWNGDGVLSGDEVRPGARRPDDLLLGERLEGRFADLDNNQDGVIARSEWTGDSRAFDRLDSNRNGVLSRDEFARGDDREQWRGDAGLFERLDTNRDGMLSREEFYRRP